MSGAMWAIVEIMGHRQRAGRLTEVQRFGAAMMQIEIPLGDADADGYRSEYYSGGSIFAFRECTEEQARRFAKFIAPPEEQRLLPASSEDAGEVDDAEVSPVDGLDEPGFDEPTFEPGGES